MARAMSASQTVIEKDRPAGPGFADGPQEGVTAPLLRAVALQRPTGELVQLVAMLDEEGQTSHAQAILDAVATMRPVEDVAAMVPLLGDAEAVKTLNVAAAQRPVVDLARLVDLLNEGGRPFLAQAVLGTVATVRPVEDIAALVPLLGDSPAAHVLHSAVAERPVEELAQLVGQLYGRPDDGAAAPQLRWKLRR